MVSIGDEGAAVAAGVAPSTNAAAANAAATRDRGGNDDETKEGNFMRHIKRSATLAALLAMVAIACVACQKPGPSNGQMTIYITGDNGGHSFSPGSISVPFGTIVTWINQDSQPHTVTVPDVFDSGPIPPNGGRWSWGASVVGTFTYHSLIQPDMNGTITVTAPTQSNY
jgi:plastocyanin